MSKRSNIRNRDQNQIIFDSETLKLSSYNSVAIFTTFNLSWHLLITFTQLIFLTLSLFYFPSTKFLYILDDSVNSLAISVILILVIQFLSESFRWILYLEGE